MKDLNALIEERKIKIAAMEGILAKGKTENRELFTSENEDFTKIQKEIDDIDKDINEKRSIPKNNNINILIKNNTMKKEFSLLSAIRDYVEGRGMSDATLQVMTQGQKDMAEAGLSYRGQVQLPFAYQSMENRSAFINATTPAEGEYTIAETKLDLVGPLRNALVVVKAGATVMTGLKGNVSIPKYSGSVSAWKAENAIAVDGKGTFSEVLLSPHRITSILDISKMFLNQDSTGAEALLMSDLNASVYGLLESTILSAGAHGDAPAGILNGTGITYTSTGTTSYPKIVALESLANTQNALTGNLAYITTPSIRGIAKTTVKSTYGSQFVVESNSMNGYPIYSTNAMAAGKVIFGNWAELFIGNWGSLDITVDPYTQAAYGAVRLVVNSYWDFAKRRTEAFAYANLT